MKKVGRFTNFLITVTVLLWIMGGMGCRHNIPPVIVAPVNVFQDEGATGVISDLSPMRVSLSDSTEKIYEALLYKRSVIEFYKLRDGEPVWITNGRRNALGDSLVLFVQGVRRHGLLPQHYHAGDIMFRPLSVANGSQLLRQEVLLTDAFLALARDLSTGRAEDRTVTEDSLRRQLLQRVATTGGVEPALLSLEPVLAPFRDLRTALNAMLDTCTAIDRALLLGGVTVDSIPLHRKVRSVEINMERWRHETRWTDERFLYINIPSFVARLYVNGNALLESKVIVGREENPTPELTSVIQCFKTYPYWHVPRKISVEELLPSIQRDPAYLERNNFDVLDRRGRIVDPDSVHWKDLGKNHFPYVLRQREGVDNSLGILKFEFDNPYGVYLHDTNAKSLFRRSVRSFSHGCIRMEKALDLAHYLVTDSIGGRSPFLQKYLRERVRHTVDVQKPLPIFVRYRTAEVVGGILYTYTDIYKNDPWFVQRMYGETRGGYY